MGLLNIFNKKKSNQEDLKNPVEPAQKPEPDTTLMGNLKATSSKKTIKPRPDDQEDKETPVDLKSIEDRVIENLKTIYDPEIPVNIFELGLIYEVKANKSGIVDVIMTLTAPNCPAAGILPGEVENKAKSVPGVKDVQLNLTFEPPWNPEMMSEAARLELGML